MNIQSRRVVKRTYFPVYFKQCPCVACCAKQFVQSHALCSTMRLASEVADNQI